MTIRLRALTFTLLMLFVVSPLSIAAESIAIRRPSIRTTDRRLRALLDEGLRHSPTLRALVARLTRSDVIVYLRCDGPSEQGVGGRLTFVSSAGGFRYVVVRMARLPRPKQIAIIAHELQHAVEIADAPGVVDGDSLVREYSRIGYVNHRSPLPGVSFDTAAAVQTGEQVLRELEGDGSY